MFNYTEDLTSGGANVSLAMGMRHYIYVDSDIPCDNSNTNPIPGLTEFTYNQGPIVGTTTLANSNIVYYDFDGDQVFEPDENDVLIDSGMAYLYDSNDNLLTFSDLHTNNGEYGLPNDPISTPQDYYIVVETDKWDSIDVNIKDKNWEGNLFVDRKGSYLDQQNIFLLENISDFNYVTDNVDVRSRNTDQQGTWDNGTITVGPDDKDQVISPIRWDLLVEGTDFPYVDLDHDGRIDPDDKDHIISPLYWDFPN